MTELEVIVLTPELEPIGPINKMTALRWTERYNDIGDFELWCPLTEENAELLKEDNLLWIGTDTLGVIEVIQKSKDEEGSLSLQISGRFNECWLERRIVWDKYSKTDYISNHMRSMVYQNAVNPSDTKRKIPNLTLVEDQETYGSSTAYSAHRDNLWDSLNELGKGNGLSLRISNNVEQKSCQFTVRKSTDRSFEQQENDVIMLSSDLSDILSSEYSLDSTGFFNLARVAGAGEGAARKEYTVNPDLTGLNRRELSVDARDISDTETWNVTITTTVTLLKTRWDEEGEPEEYRVQTVITKVMTYPETGEERTTTESKVEWTATEPDEGTTIETGTEEVPIPDDEYNAMLAERGKSYLADNAKVEAFNSQVRMTGERAYTYGEDYFLGDRITVQDKDLAIQISTEVTEVEQSWDENSYSVVLTLGNSAPTIKQLIKKRS